MSSSEIEALVRLNITRLTINSVPPPGAELAVILEVGHSDVGSTSDRDTVVQATTFEHACEVLLAGRSRVLGQFVMDILQVRRGIKEGWAADDGSIQYAIAQIVARGNDGEVLPISGFYVACNPVVPEAMRACDWEDCCWDDLFG